MTKNNNSNNNNNVNKMNYDLETVHNLLVKHKLSLNVDNAYNHMLI